MEKLTGNNWYMILFKGIVLTALAFFVLFNPEGTIKTVAFFLGIGFFAMGIVLVIRGIPKRKDKGDWNPEIVEGIADLILGFLMIVAPLALATVIPFLIGIWAAIYGIMCIIDSFRASSNGAILLLMGVVILLLSLILIFKPLLLGLTIVIWLGILLLAAGIFNIYLAIRTRQDLKKVN